MSTTIRDVAALAGVSLATASRALTGSSGTARATRERVQEAAATLGYVVNGPARALRRARTDVLGLIVSDVRNPFFGELAHSAEKAARQEGFSLLLADIDEDGDRASAALQSFASQRIDGLIIAPHPAMTAQLTQLVASDLPFVFVDRTVHGFETVPSVTTDNDGGTEAAVRWLKKRGHRDVAYVGGPSSVSAASERLHHYLRHARAAGLCTDPELLAEGDFRSGSGGPALENILDRGVRPTALFCADGVMTLDALRAVRRRGCERSIRDAVSFDDNPAFDLLDPPVSAVLNDAAAMGREAIGTLVRRISGVPVGSTVIRTTFIDRSPS